jgi:hypothetical protein
MYHPVFLQTENELNKILRKQKKSKQELAILFTSLWDSYCQDLIAKIRYRELIDPVPREEAVPLYVVDSYKMPHAFVIFKTSKLPHFVYLNRSNVESVDYLPNIYEELGL